MSFTLRFCFHGSILDIHFTIMLFPTLKTLFAKWDCSEKHFYFLAQKMLASLYFGLK